MKYRTQSANVLNEADRFQAILDWQLFCMEQDSMLWGDNSEYDGQWRPGVPIHEHPYVLSADLHQRILFDRNPTEIDLWDGSFGNHVRPMLQEFDDGDQYGPTICCDVSWSQVESPSQCWVCGKEFQSLKQMSFLPKSVYALNPPIDPPQYLFPSGPAIGRVVSVETTEEGIMFATVQMGLEREMGMRWRTLMQAIFERQMRDLVLVPACYVDNTWEERVSWRPGIGRFLRQAGWERYVFEKPEIEVPQFDLPKPRYGGKYEVSATSINTPITNMRRRRNV
jgi:hypothetical protein